MKKFLAIVAITSIMASCTDSSTTDDASSDSSAAPMQSAPLDSSSITPDSAGLQMDTTNSVRPDSPATK